MRRYGRLFLVQLRASLTLAAQYRSDFLLEALVELVWGFNAIVPLLIVYGDRPSIGGWTAGEALLVVGFFSLLQATLEGAINPGLNALVEHIRKGTLDLILLKPADAQFLVSTARFQPWKAVGAVVAGAIFAQAFRLIGRGPRPAEVAAALGMFAAAVTTLYALWIMVASLAFHVVKVDNLTFLLDSLFDAARWPSSVFRGLARFLFTFVLPLGLMTTFPAEALLGRLSIAHAAAGIGGALGLLVASRLLWVWSVGRYSSASS
jgi:ABC-2 type transport system permease protein